MVVLDFEWILGWNFDGIGKMDRLDLVHILFSVCTCNIQYDNPFIYMDTVSILWIYCMVECVIFEILFLWFRLVRICKICYIKWLKMYNRVIINFESNVLIDRYQEKN